MNTYRISCMKMRFSIVLVWRLFVLYHICQLKFNYICNFIFINRFIQTWALYYVFIWDILTIDADSRRLKDINKIWTAIFTNRKIRFPSIVELNNAPLIWLSSFVYLRQFKYQDPNTSLARLLFYLFKIRTSWVKCEKTSHVSSEKAGLLVFC